MLMHRHDSGWHDMISRANVRHVSTCCASLGKKHEWLVIIDEFFNKKHERQI